MLAKKIKLIIKHFCFLLLIVLVVGCGKHFKHAKLPPVVEGWYQSTAIKNAYIVQKKDTLYSIAWAFGMDYRELAKRNNLKPPYSLHYGQRLYISCSGKSLPLLVHSKIKVQSPEPIKGWTWPARGKIAAMFNNKLGGNKGIDIAGSYSDPVLASNSGRVVYSGMGIRSYGKLIIIKHSDDYLSAYAYNRSMLVHEGLAVQAGQKIATMGHDDLGNIRLHFEIRKMGKPVNPLLYLTYRS